MASWSDVTVQARREWASGLVTLTFDTEVPQFRAGQFVNLGLESEGSVVRRPYSLSSGPGAPAEVFLTEVDGGALTPRLLRLQPGDRVLMDRTPQGTFTLDGLPSRPDLWLIATGTGLAPFVSMLRDPATWARFEQVYLVHGVRQNAHRAYGPDWAQLADRFGPRFRQIGCVSRELPLASALPGRVTERLADGTLERALNGKISQERSHLLLCGNPSMISDVMLHLDRRGLKRHRVRQPGNITIEKYW